MDAPPANACAHSGAPRSPGGARPTATCAVRAAASRKVWPAKARAARAHRRSVDHPVDAGPRTRQAHTRCRTSSTGIAIKPHSASAMQIAAWL